MHGSLNQQFQNQRDSTPMPGLPVRVPSRFQPSGFGTPVQSEKFEVIKTAIAREEEGDQAYDPERDGVEAPHRPFLLTHAFMVSLAMILVVVVEFACIASKCGIYHWPRLC